MILRFRPLVRLSLLIGSLLLVMMIACRAEGPEGGTPVPTIESPSLVPPEVPMTTLLRNPASFDGQTIRVTGQYRSIPIQVCRDDTHRSPATWSLVFGDVETFVAGYDDALRPLADAGLSLTIEGRWQRWSGPVGCGRRAPTQEIWYLAASRIVSPNPLVRSEPEDGGIVLVPSPTTDGEFPEGEETLQGFPTEEPDEEPTSGPDGNPTPAATQAPPPTFQTIPTPPLDPTNTVAPSLPTQATTAIATSTPTLRATTTITAGGTAATGTPTATASSTTTGGTPAATSEPADQGMLAFNTVEKQTLAANSPHSWRFNPPASEPIIITAGSALGLNISLDLVAPDGTVVVKANQAGAGQPETITYTTPNPTGEYRVVVSGDGGTSGAYVLMMFDSESLPVVVIQNTIVYGSGGSGSIPEGIDHFWNFEGQAGDVITIEVSPTGNSGNLIFYLLGVDGTELEFINDIDGVGSESLTAYTLPETGFYSIWIGEYDFAEVDYTMTLTQ